MESDIYTSGNYGSAIHDVRDRPDWKKPLSSGNTAPVWGVILCLISFALRFGLLTPIPELAKVLGLGIGVTLRKV